MRPAREPLKVSGSTMTFHSAAEAATEDVKARERIANSDVLLIPVRPGLDYEDAVFAADTRGFLKHLERNGAELRIELATDEEAPPELVLHGDLVQLGTILVTLVAAPIIVNLASNYIWERIKRGSKDPDKSQVRCELHIAKPDGSTLMLQYDGPAKDFETLMRAELPLPEAQPKAFPDDRAERS
jgi:hypothetical protein